MPRLALLCLLTMAGATISVAQTPDSTPARDTIAVELPTIEVIGSILPSAGPSIGSGLPASTAVLSRADLEKWETRLLSESMQRLPGVSLYDDLGARGKLTLSMRGFNSSPVVGLGQGISVFLDGIRQNEPDAAQVNFDLLPMEHVRRVEVLYGTGSILGRNSIGGAINLISARGQGKLGGDIELTGGNFQSFGGQGSIGGSDANGWDYYAGGGYSSSDGWRNVTASHEYNGFINLGKTRERSGYRFQAYGAKSYAETAGSLPLSVFRTTPDSNLSAEDFEDLNSVQVAAMGYTVLGQGVGSANVYYRRHRAERFNVNQEDDPDALGKSRNGTFGGAVDYRRGWQTGNGTRIGLRLGADGATSRTEVELFADSTKFDGDVTQTTFVKSPTWDAGVYGLLDFTFGKVTLTGGARFDYVRVPFENQLDPTKDTTSSYSRVNPRVGIGFQASPEVTLFSSVGTSFRAPAVIELACADPDEPCPLPFALGDDPPLDPVTATTFEAGARYIGSHVSLSAAAYLTNVRNEIFLFPYDDAGAPTGSTIDGYFGNLGKTRRVGFELGANFFFKGGHSGYLNYAYTKATFEEPGEIFSIREEDGAENEVEPGDRIPLVPDHQIKGGLNLQLPSGFEVGAQGRFIGEQWLRGDEANDTEPLDGYFVADARLGWSYGPWEISGMVTNVFQKKYASFGTFNINQGGGDVLERFLTPGYKRTFQLIVRRTFGGGGGDD